MKSASAHALPLHFLDRFEPLGFDEFAASEIEAAPYWVAGQCFNPLCARDFNPSRAWQKYCCAACRRQVVDEMRRWGHRLALPLLVWRMGKYETTDQAVRDRTNAARRHLSHAQTLWVQERRALTAQAQAGQAIERSR